MNQLNYHLLLTQENTMIRRAINDSVKYLFAWIKKWRKIKPKDKVVMVNLGSGLGVCEGWYNVDGNFNTLFAGSPAFFLKFLYRNTGAKNWFELEDYLYKLSKMKFVHHNLEYGIPFADNTIDYLYTAGTFEHFYPDRAKQLLNKAYKAMKPNGLIRITVPDLEHIIGLFNSGKTKEALTYFYEDSLCDHFSRHKYLYNFELLKEFLEEAGFVNVKKYDIYEGEMPDIDKLDLRPGETLFVEARKPVV